MTAATQEDGSVQRMRALQRANEVRGARAALKRRIATGETSVAEAILGGGAELASMPLIELMMSQRSWGHARCARLLVSIPLSENKPVGSMTDRQLAVLVAMLRAANQSQRFDPSRRAQDARSPAQCAAALAATN
jgi:hypothetical protein